MNTIYDGNEVFYVASVNNNLHIEQLWSATLSPADLTERASGVDVAGGSSPAGFIDPIAATDNVFYIGTDGRPHVMTWSPSPGWEEDTRLDGTSVPAAISGSALVAHNTNYEEPSQNSQQLLYQGTNQHIYELWRWSRNFDGWHQNDITAASGTPDVAAPGTPMVGFYDRNQALDAIFYLGSNQHIYEIEVTSKGWLSTDITLMTGAPVIASGGNLAAHWLNGIEELFWVDGNQNVQEFYEYAGSTIWNRATLTTLTGAKPNAMLQTPLATDWSTIDNTDHVFYIATDGNVHEFWSNGTWNADDVNTQMSPPAPDAAQQ